MPRVSICIPTYENPDEVKQLVESILEQTFTDYEVIITDDSKDDRIQEYIEKLKASDTRAAAAIRYQHNERPLGHIYNWNEAIRHARGDYIKVMFSDDWFTYPDSLEKLVALLEENPKASLAFCGSMQVSEREAYARKPEEGYTDRLREDYRYLFISNQIGAPSDTLYRRKEGIAFDERSNWASDVFLYMEILRDNPRFVCTDEPLISIGIHENQYTESFNEHDERIYRDYRYMFEKYELQKSRQCRDYFLMQYIIRFGRSRKEAQENGYGTGEYLKALLTYYRKEVLPCMWKAAGRKISRIFKSEKC